jgi:hypothetical protein
MVAALAVPFGLFGALVGQVDIDVRAAGAPVARAVASRLAFGALRLHRFVRRGPHAAALEPLHHRRRLFALQLRERRLQLRRLARAKRRRALANQDGPVRRSRHDQSVRKITKTGARRRPIHDADGVT